MTKYRFRFLPTLRDLARDKKGLAAIEFAMVLPVMFFLFFGATELYTHFSARDRVDIAASTLVDLAGWSEQLAQDDIEGIFTGVSNIIQPIDVEQLEMRLISVVPNNQGSPVVHWSFSSEATASQPYAPNSAFDLENSDLLIPGASVLVSEVEYIHESGITGKVLGTSQAYTETRVRLPRLSPRVAFCEKDNQGVYENCI